MRKPSLGEQELELLRFVAEKGPVTVGEVTESYGAAHGLSRSTVVTVMERLRKKGYLQREQQAGVFRYSCPVEQQEIVGGLIQRFVERTLAGSLMPFAAYFGRSNRLSEEEQRELERLIAKLETPKSSEDAANKETEE